MKKTKWIVSAVVALVVLWLVSFGVGFYNSTVALNEQVDNNWAQVETQYQRRFDLIPNLVESVKGAMTQEQEVFGQLAEARTRYAGATGVNDRVEAAGQVEGALARLLVVMENYPQLKSSETVRDLMVQLEGTENRIAVARKDFNDGVKAFNVKIKRFPGMILAGWFNFSEKNFFESVEAAATAPAVNLKLNEK